MPHAVGTRRPNPWGLYDVRGNAAEWCADFRDTTPEPPLMGVLEDPPGPPNGRLRILLGSSFANEDPYTAAGNATPTMRYPTWGGRLMCEIDGAPRAAPTTQGSGTGKSP
jgi:formylglycine-generating enzyme required for sulfatase activity